MKSYGGLTKAVRYSAVVASQRMAAWEAFCLQQAFRFVLSRCSVPPMASNEALPGPILQESGMHAHTAYSSVGIPVSVVPHREPLSGYSSKMACRSPAPYWRAFQLGIGVWCSPLDVAPPTPDPVQPAPPVLSFRQLPLTPACLLLLTDSILRARGPDEVGLQQAIELLIEQPPPRRQHLEPIGGERRGACCRQSSVCACVRSPGG